MSEENLKPKEEWLREYSKESTKRLHSKNFDDFCAWAKTNDVELVKEYKATDPRDFSRRWGKRIVEYYNWLLKEGKKINTARSKTVAIRSFLRSHCIEPKIKRGAIAKAQMAFGEHEFTLDELQKMYRVGDIKDKTKLAVAVSLGWGVEDFINLKRSFIEPYLAENLELPVAFWYERGKTAAPSRSHFTHEAIENLRALRELEPKSEYVFTGQNGHMCQDAVNDWLKSLVKRAGIEARGKIRFHLLRKFLMSQLSASGMNQWETKLCVGKTIPTDILTYLKDQTENLRTKFMNAEARFTLSGYTNSNHGKIDMINEKVETLESIIQKQEVQIQEQNQKVETLAKGLSERDYEIKLMKATISKLAGMMSSGKGERELKEIREEKEEKQPSKQA